MNWFIKHSAQSVIALTPWPGLYRWIQRYVTKTIPSPLTMKLANAEKHIHAIQSYYGFIPNNQLAFCEIGTGWTPIIALIISLALNGKFTLVDKNSWMDDLCIDVQLKSLENSLTKIENLAPGQEVRKKYQCLKRAWENCGRSALLQVANCKYCAPADTKQLLLKSSSTDVVMSTCVLGYIPPNDLEAIHKESYRILKSGGIIIHDIDLTDQRHKSDKKVHPLEFLKWSSSLWFSPLFTNRYNYFNRLREKCHVKILKNAGFDIIKINHELREDDLSFVKRLKLAKEFKKFSLDELSIRRTYIVAVKP